MDDNVNDDLQFWIAESGQEFYLHMSVWQDIPFTFKMDSKVESIDIAMKKVVWTKNKDCGSPDNYNYIGIGNDLVRAGLKESLTSRNGNKMR